MLELHMWVSSIPSQVQFLSQNEGPQNGSDDHAQRTERCHKHGASFSDQYALSIICNSRADYPLNILVIMHGFSYSHNIYNKCNIISTGETPLMVSECLQHKLGPRFWSRSPLPKRPCRVPSQVPRLLLESSPSSISTLWVRAPPGIPSMWMTE